MTQSLFDLYEESPFPISVDTRTLKEGDLFFALDGVKVDGHHYVHDALSKGAAFAVVSQKYDSQQLHAHSHSRFHPHANKLIYVPNPLLALQDLARRKMAAFKGTVIAITGSAGKTTTKDFLCQLLSHRFHVSSSPGNQNSQIGLPLAILNNLPLNADFYIAEMGMTHPGNISNLVSIAPPHVSVVTTVALAHAENFSSLDQIAAAKAEIFSHPRTKIRLAYSQAALLPSMSAVPDLLTFGDAESRATFSMVIDCDSMHVTHKGKPQASFAIPPLMGKHNHMNLFASALTAHTAGMPWQEIQEAAKLCLLPKKRLQLKEKDGITFIDDSYNATCIGIKASLEFLESTFLKRTKIAVLGEMKELGSFSAESHKEVVQMALAKVDVAIFIGDSYSIGKDMLKSSSKPCYFVSNDDEVLALLHARVRPGDVILLKGSNVANLGSLFEKY